MARLPRISPIGVPQHIIQRGNNRQACFVNKQDFVAYISWLKDYANQYSVDIHAWVLMTNHVHLLCSPQAESAISKMMQSLGRKYVRYFNHQYQRTGTLWEGRYKSCLVDAEDYLLHLYRYIELNPVRAGMVEHPVDYTWSSYQINALGKESDLCTPHKLYESLGNNKSQRLNSYQELFNTHIADSTLQEIRASIKKGIAIGSEGFKQQTEQLISRKKLGSE